MSSDRRPLRYALLAVLLATLVIVGLDVGTDRAGTERAGLPETLRGAGAAVTGPVLTAIANTFPDPPGADLERAELATELSLTQEQLTNAEDSAALIGADHVIDTRDAGRTVVLGRVVALGAIGPAGPERLTIDLGARDGIALAQSVVTVDGLLGRTVRVGATTSDVLILGAADLVMGARAEDSELIGTVGSVAPAPRDPGQLTFSAIDFGDLAEGEVIRTLGSPDDIPFVAGLPIGTVAGIDPSRGRIGLTAAVTPVVDIGRVGVVAVVVPGSIEADGD